MSTQEKDGSQQRSEGALAGVRKRCLHRWLHRLAFGRKVDSVGQSAKFRMSFAQKLPVWITVTSARAHVRFHVAQRNGLVKPRS